MTQTNVKASFDTESLEGKMKVFNAQNGASISLKSLDTDTVLDVVAVLQYEQEIDSYGTTGQIATVTTLFAENGDSYAGVSETIAQAGSGLIDFMKVANLDAYKLKIVKQNSSKGNEFLNMQLIG